MLKSRSSKFSLVVSEVSRGVIYRQGAPTGISEDLFNTMCLTKVQSPMGLIVPSLDTAPNSPGIPKISCSDKPYHRLIRNNDRPLSIHVQTNGSDHPANRN
jgi:hypothetical protein